MEEHCKGSYIPSFSCLHTWSTYMRVYEWVPVPLCTCEICLMHWHTCERLCCFYRGHAFLPLVHLHYLFWSMGDIPCMHWDKPIHYIPHTHAWVWTHTHTLNSTSILTPVSYEHKHAMFTHMWGQDMQKGVLLSSLFGVKTVSDDHHISECHS